MSAQKVGFEVCEKLNILSFFLVLKKLKLWDFMLRFSSVLAAISKINSVDAKFLKPHDILCIDLFDVQDDVERNPSHVAMPNGATWIGT